MLMGNRNNVRARIAAVAVFREGRSPLVQRRLGDGVRWLDDHVGRNGLEGSLYTFYHHL